MSSDIDIVKTGRGLAASRIALIFAPPNASASSLYALTEYLNRQPGMKAIPGYHGPNQNHVLRVSGIPDDASFMALLKASPVGVSETLTCEPLDEVDHFPHQPLLRRVIKENANTATGIAYMAGSMALLLAAWRKPQHMPGKPNHDWYRSYTACAYFAASAILVALSRKSDNPRDVYTIMEQIYPSLSRPDAPEPQLREEAGRIEQFLRNHPWEISMLLNASGATAHAISSYKRGWKTELAAALATLTACSMSAVIPEKGGRSLLPVSEWLEDSQGRSPYERLEEYAAQNPGWARHVVNAFDWVQENPLKISAYVSGAANIGYAASGVMQPNYPLAAMSAAFAAGNYTQSQATKGRGDGFDSVVTAAASILKHDPVLAKLTPQKRQARIEKLADTLTQQREVVHSKARLVRGIRARLDGGFLPSEAQLLRENPFSAPQSWRDSARASRSESGAQASSVASL